MTRSVSLADGPYEGWTVQATSWASWEKGTHTRLLTMHGPPMRPEVEHLRIALTLRVPARDAQADLIATAENLHPASPQLPTIAERALALTLPRVHATVADPHRKWRITATAASQLIGNTDLPDGSSVQVAGSAAWPPAPSAALEARARLHAAIRHYAGREEWIGAPRDEPTFAWLLTQAPRLPNMPPPADDWASRTTAFLDQLADQHIDKYQVTHTNAINGRGRTHTVDTLDEVVRLAAAQPYNNTLVSVHRVLDFRCGIATVESVDLAATASARPPAAAAFPPPGVTPQPAPPAAASTTSTPRQLGPRR